MLVLRCKVLFHSLCYLLLIYLGSLILFFKLYFRFYMFYRFCELYALKRLCFYVFPGFVSRFRASFSSSSSGDLVVVNSYSIYVFKKDCIFPSYMKLIFAGYKILADNCFV